MKTKEEAGYFDGYKDEDTAEVGAEIYGKDVVLLNAPKVKLCPDTPLLTKAQDVAGAINELFQLDPGGGDDWTFPEHWPEIPDPEPNQVIMYVEANAGDVAPIIGLYGNNFDGGTINYGDDGYTYEYPAGYGYNVYHVYQVAGQYIITITAPGGEVYLNASSTNVAFMVGHIVDPPSSSGFGGYNSSDNQCQCIRAIKVGSDIQLNQGGTPLGNGYYGKNLVYLEFSGEIKNTEPRFNSFYALKKLKIGTPPEIFGSTAFQNCYSLEKADFMQNCTSISQGMFSSCYALKSADLPNVVSESGAAFSVCYSLQSVNAPKLAEIDSAEFNYCYSLQKLTLADGCNLNGNTFVCCPQLYPKPQ